MEMRGDYIERLKDERSFKVEIQAIERIVDFEERKRKLIEDVDFQ
jgi:fructose-1,6-bisphosphatase